MISRHNGADKLVACLDIITKIAEQIAVLGVMGSTPTTLTRMSDLQMQEKSFTPREYEKPQLDAAEILASMQIKIKIRIHRSVMESVLDYCPYEHLLPDGEEHYIVSFPFVENEYYYNILFSFGDKCECLEPLHIRNEMKRRIYDIAAIYES